MAVEGKIEHIGGITDPSARYRLFLEWFAFARVDDAVITSHSSFGYTAYARSLRIPVSFRCPSVAQSRDCHSNLDAAPSRAVTVGVLASR